MEQEDKESLQENGKKFTLANGKHNHIFVVSKLDFFFQYFRSEGLRWKNHRTLNPLSYVIVKCFNSVKLQGKKLFNCSNNVS